MPNESDTIPLSQLPRVRPPRPWRRCFETVAVVGSLFLGGFGLGSVYATRHAEAQIALHRDDHLGEVERLRQAYETRLSMLSGQVTAAADTADRAAHTAGDAATTAQSAAQAIKQVTRAAKEPRKP